MLTYSLQVQICWLLFYATYYALLSRETFFALNRFYLLLSLIGGLVLPFAADCFAVKVAVTLVAVDFSLLPIIITATALPQNTEGVVLRILMSLYAIGVAVLASRFLAGLFLIFKILKTGKREAQSDFTLIYTEGGVPPFSFFNFIFINPKEFEKVDFQQIMQHEQAHVRQRHSFDVVFVALLCCVFWFSPLIWFIRKSLRNIHEYEADSAVLKTNSTPQYGRLLLRQSQFEMSLTLTSNISNHFFSQLKKRILMMTRHKSKRPALMKYALAVPIFLLLTVVLASPKTQILTTTETVGDKLVSTIDKVEKSGFDVLKDELGKAVSVLSDVIGESASPKMAFNTTDTDDFSKLKEGDFGYKSFLVTENTPPQYAAANDTVVKPIAEVQQVNVNDIERMDVKKEDAEGIVIITVTMKDGRIEQFRGTKAEVNSHFKKDKIEERPFNTVRIYSREPNEASGQLVEVPVEGPRSSEPVFTIVEEQPIFPTGQAALFKWLGEHIKYPASARQAKAEGTVYIGFVVEADGAITNVTIKRDVPVILRDTITLLESNGMKGNKVVERTEYSLGKEAVRVISMMPNWKAGKQNGRLVRVAYTLPIKFKLE